MTDRTETTTKIPGSADEACLNALRAGWREWLMVRLFGEILVSKNEHGRAVARRYDGKIYMVGSQLKSADAIAENQNQKS